MPADNPQHLRNAFLLIEAVAICQGDDSLVKLGLVVRYWFPATLSGTADAKRNTHDAPILHNIGGLATQRRFHLAFRSFPLKSLRICLSNINSATTHFKHVFSTSSFSAFSPNSPPCRHNPSAICSRSHPTYSTHGAHLFRLLSST